MIISPGRDLRTFYRDLEAAGVQDRDRHRGRQARAQGHRLALEAAGADPCLTFAEAAELAKGKATPNQKIAEIVTRLTS